MLAKMLLASAMVGLGVFLAAAATLAVIRVREAGIDFRGVFAPKRFLPFVGAATGWALGGLVYLVLRGGGGGDLAGLYGPVLVAGWAASLGLWMLFLRFFTPRGAR